MGKCRRDVGIHLSRNDEAFAVVGPPSEAGVLNRPGETPLM
jgi:hypothetical protein